jgi:hypothetical protein
MISKVPQGFLCQTENLLIKVGLAEAVPAQGIIAIHRVTRTLVVEGLSSLTIRRSYRAVSKSTEVSEY